MHSILWPERYLPGTTDNFVSNEVIVKGLTAAEVWPLLNNTAHWTGYYNNVSEIGFEPGNGPELRPGLRFHFKTFQFPVLAEVIEYAPAAAGKPARLAWSGLIEGDAENRLDVVHAWLIEDLPGGRVRILTQETQNGAPARAMAVALPNPMLNAHQDWLNGLVKAALEHKAS
jgi:hypothetical protein